MLYDATVREGRNTKSGYIVDVIFYRELTMSELMQLISITVSKSDAQIITTGHFEE